MKAPTDSIKESTPRPFLRRTLWALMGVLFFTGCATPPPLGPNQARINGNQIGFVARADAPEPRQYENSLIVPAGPTRIAIRLATGGGLVGAAMSGAAGIKEAGFRAETGHEYQLRFNPKMWWAAFKDGGVLVVDEATGQTVGEAAKTQKKP